MWNHFVVTNQLRSDDVITARTDYKLIVHKLNNDVIQRSSPLLLLHAITSLQMWVECSVRDKLLHCDQFVEKEGVLMPSSFLVKFDLKLIFSKNIYLVQIIVVLNSSDFQFFVNTNNKIKFDEYR